MFFDIDADLVYTRPHMTKVDGRVVIIEENITVKPSASWKRIHISSNLIASLQDKLSSINDIFDIEQFGQMFAASAFETYREIDDSEEPFVKLIIHPELKTLGTKEEAKSLWDGADFVDSWQQAFESFEDYYKQYSDRRYGIIKQKWFENAQGDKVTQNTESYRELGSYHENIWYSEPYHFAGFTNVKGVKAFDPQTGKRSAIKLDKVIKEGISNLQKAAFQADESLEEYYNSIDADSYKDWHEGRIKFFQQKFGHKSKLYQQLIFILMDVGNAGRRLNERWSWIKPVVEGALIGFGIVLGSYYLMKLFT